MDLSKDGALWHVDGGSPLNLLRMKRSSARPITNATGHRLERCSGQPQPVQNCMDIYPRTPTLRM